MQKGASKHRSDVYLYSEISADYRLADIKNEEIIENEIRYSMLIPYKTRKWKDVNSDINTMIQCSNLIMVFKMKFNTN